MIKSEYGFCQCCSLYTKFVSNHEWLRDHYICEKCGCIPRERAIMKVINDWIKNIHLIDIHESSPSPRGASLRLKKISKNYISSHYWREEKYFESPHININLEKQNFEDSKFDLVVTQDVFEHLPDPKTAAQEIFRTLKPGGYFIQTVPLVNGFETTQKWASLGNNGEIEWHFEPDYHGNPIDPKGSPVFWHYGYDLASAIDKWAGFNSIIISNHLPEYGIEGALCEVILSKKPHPGDVLF